VMATPGFTMEMLLLKNEISQLKEIIASAVEQIKKAIESLHVPSHTKEPTAMETEVEENPHTLDQPNPSQIDLPAIIRELKNDIATISHETRDMFYQCMPPQTKTKT